MFNFGGSNISINFNGDNSNHSQMSKYIYLIQFSLDQQNIMNLINSVTSGMNFNFGSNFFNNVSVNESNDNNNDEDNEDSNEYDFENT